MTDTTQSTNKGTDAEPAARRWSFGPTVLDERTLELVVNGEAVRVERKPLEVLLFLLHHAGEVVTKDEILEAVWPGRILSESVLTKAITKLREALKDEQQEIILTQHGYGYRLVSKVKVEVSSAPPPPRFDFKKGDHPRGRPLWSLVERLGTGGHGEAWLARHDKTHETRVYKFALEDSCLPSLKREITVSRLLHDSLGERGGVFIRVLEWNLEEQPYFIECEYAAGGNLVQWAEVQGGLDQLPIEVRLDLVIQIAEALAAAHSVDVLHKDLKPSNVLMATTQAGHPPRIKLCDFGSGGVMELERLKALGITQMGFTQTMNSDGNTSGTPLYFAPEVLAGQPATKQADIYALGVILFQMVVGDLRRSLAPGWERDVDDELLREDIAEAADGKPQRRLADAGDLAQRLRSLEARRVQRAQAREAAAAVAAQHAAERPTRDIEHEMERGQIAAPVKPSRRGLAAILALGVLIAGSLALWRMSSTQTPKTPSIAVLPFDSLGGGSENSYFADGITEDIITDLSKLSGILVIARNSSWTYKGKSVKVQEVAKDLGVRYVLEGSVRREGDTVRINAELVDALGGQHLWAERYDGSIRDVFALQDKVIGQIVAALAVNLSHDEQTRVELAETRDPQAYDAVLRGWAHYRQGSEDETNKSIALFEQAIALDPGYARAHAALAAAEWRIVQSYWESTTEGGYQRAFDRMQAALVKAMRQPNALAHTVSAEFLSKQGRYTEAFTEMGLAMALAPNDPGNYLSKARILNATGRAAEAEESVRWAMRLDPLYSPDYLRTLAVSLFHQRRYEEAVGTVEKLLALQTDVPDDYITLIASLGHLGRKSGIPEAVKTFNELSVSAGYNSITVQMFGAWWWYGDLINYDPAYRDQLIEGLRKAGVPEGAGTDIPFEKYRQLVHSNKGYFDVTGATKIDPKEAKTLHDRGVKFVDVRAAKGFASGHVPGAFNLDVATELSRDSLSRIVGKNEEFVLSCHGKTCSDSAYASAKALMWGFKRVYYFSGGFPAWKEAGYPVEVSPKK